MRLPTYVAILMIKAKDESSLNYNGVGRDGDSSSWYLLPGISHPWNAFAKEGRVVYFCEPSARL